MARNLTLLSLTLLLLSLPACAGSRATGAYHVVAKGQTLYTISKVYGVDENYLARINGISDPTRLRIGDRIFIPGARQPVTVPATVRPDIVDPSPVKKPGLATHPAAPSVPTRPPEKASPTPPAPTGPPTAAKPTAAKPPAVKSPTATKGAPVASTPAPLAKGRLIWPVQGRVVKRFDTRSAAGSKGLEIAVAADTPVASSAAGKVIYSGDGITGYGNLVIIRHDDALFTVYGYNRKNLVEVGAFVSKGEKIALAGVPPSGGTPRLYFEIRQGKKPVDPLFYLP